jgi:hypothetical protein
MWQIVGKGCQLEKRNLGWRVRKAEKRSMEVMGKCNKSRNVMSELWKNNQKAEKRRSGNMGKIQKKAEMWKCGRYKKAEKRKCGKAETRKSRIMECRQKTKIVNHDGV